MLIKIHNKFNVKYLGCAGGVGSVERARGRVGDTGRISSHASGSILMIHLFYDILMICQLVLYDIDYREASFLHMIQESC